MKHTVVLKNEDRHDFDTQRPDAKGDVYFYDEVLALIIVVSIYDIDYLF